VTVEIRLEVRKNNLPLLTPMDLSKPFARFATYMHGEVDEMFETEGASRGTPWPYLAPSTLAKKSRLGRSLNILVFKGRMKSNFGVLDITPDVLVFGVPDHVAPQAKYHDSDEPRTKLPRRKLMRVTPNDLVTIERFTAGHFEATAEGGLGA